MMVAATPRGIRRHRCVKWRSGGGAGAAERGVAEGGVAVLRGPAWWVALAAQALHRPAHGFHQCVAVLVVRE